MAKKYVVILMGLCLCFGSCSTALIFIDFVNQTSTPVIVSYSTRFKKRLFNPEAVYYDTIEVKSDSTCLLVFRANSAKSLCKYISYFKFETPTKSVRFEGPEEVMKIFNHKKELGEEYKFIITDSLFTDE